LVNAVMKDITTKLNYEIIKMLINSKHARDIIKSIELMLL